MKRFSFVSCLLLMAALAATPLEGQAAEAAKKGKAKGKGKAGVKFEMHRIGNYRSEACGVGDFNGDGKLDVVAGPFLYLAPDFKATKIREIKGLGEKGALSVSATVDEQGKGYMCDFMTVALDVDEDGRTDVVSCDWFQKNVWWNRNPGTAGASWPEAELVKAGNHETGEILDVDGDGKAREVVPHVQPTVWYEFVKGTDGKISAKVHTVCAKPMGFGVGVGDLNGDGRPDFIREKAWFEAPADPRKGEWKEHPIDLAIAQPKPGIAAHLSMILVHDVNRDGLNDLVYTAAHGYGICWAEQKRQGEAISFERHTIDDTWTQAHSIALADLDGDGVKELVTGKRFMAHNGGDPEEVGTPLRVCYYKPAGKRALKWRRFAISENQGIGAGMNVEPVDFDGDGDLDIVVTGKWGGPVWFENKGK